MDPRGTLTHVFPFVCKSFYKLCRTSDTLWKDALSIMVKKEPEIWRAALDSLITGQPELQSPATRPDASSTSSNLSQAGTISSSRKITDSKNLIDLGIAALAKVQETPSVFAVNDTAPTMRLFRHLVKHYFRITGPVFYMPGQARLGQEFGLHFFEPRYRLLIEEVMAEEPSAHRHGMPIVPLKGRTFPQFIYANHSSLAPGSPACLVQVRQCSIYPDRRADVVLKPIAYVWLERIVVRPNSGNLCEATVTRMGQIASHAIEHSNAPFRGPASVYDTDLLRLGAP